MDGGSPRTEANQHVTLDINTAWLESVKEKVGASLDRKPPSKPTIFRVPPDMRCGNQGAYEPKLISIGPYHRGKSEDLKAMEELKWRLLHHYFSMVPNRRMNEGLKRLRDLEQQARDCYSEVIDLDSNQFVEMLLLDGCFLVQILDVSMQGQELRSLLFGNEWFRGHIFRDLILLENQLPYFIIEHLLDTLMPGCNRSCLQEVVISWFVDFLPQYSNVPEPKLPDEGFQVDHLLHLFHKWILSVPKLEKASNTRSCSKIFLELPCSALSLMINASGSCLSKVLPWCNNSSLSEGPPLTVPTKTHSTSCLMINANGNASPLEGFAATVPTTTELAEAGVKIKVKKANSFLDISFCADKGVLEIPAILITDNTKFFFANLVALEQCSRMHKMVVTHYTAFFDDIINTPRDAELLHREGIIHRYVGADEDIASLFNKLCYRVFCNPKAGYLKDVYRDLNTYCQSSWPRWRAKAVRDYFSNPWSIISLGAAVLLIGLTILQSVYTMLSYYK